MATLDSYYSHQPIEIQLASAVLGLAELTPPEGEQRPFDNLLRETNGWLADELYLHPKSIAALSWYEDQATPKIIQQFSDQNSEKGRRGLLTSWLKVGCLTPQVDKRIPLVRLKFRDSAFPTSVDLEELAGDFQPRHNRPKYVFSAMHRNTANGLIYFDLMVNPRRFGLQNIAPIYIEAYKWLIRRVQRMAERSINDMLPEEIRDLVSEKDIRQLESSIYSNEFKIELRNFSRLFISFINRLLPNNLEMRISEFVGSDEFPVPTMVRVYHRNGAPYDQITARLQPREEEGRPRHQEYKAIELVANNSFSNVQVICAEKMTLHEIGSVNKTELDQWDGVVLEVFDNVIKLSIIEAKRIGGPIRNENAAMRQLDETRKLLAIRDGITYRRQRIKGLGAYLRYTFPV